MSVPQFQSPDLVRAMDKIDEALVRLAFVRTHLALVHELAFTTGGSKPDNNGGRSYRLAHYGDETGDDRARKAWKLASRLIASELAGISPQVVKTEGAMRALLREGERDERMTDSLITPEEHAEALRMQAKRGGTPAFEQQPKHPKGRK